METVWEPEGSTVRHLVLEARLLGGCTLHYDGRLVPESAFRRRRALTLLLWLLATPGHSLSRDATLEWLWPEEDPSVSAASLRVVLSALRAALGIGPDEPGPVVRRGATLSLDPNLDLRIDADAFETAASRALASADLAAMQAAALLYTGPLLPALAYEDWAVVRREALDRLHERLLAALAGAEATTDPAAAEERLRALLAADHADEAAARALMSLLAGTGRRAEALRTYQALVNALRDELGLAPSAETEAVRTRLLAHEQRSAIDTLRGGDRLVAVRQPQPLILPAGQVTFLMATIEGLAGPWIAQTHATDKALAHCKGLMEEASIAHRGVTLAGRSGDETLIAVFARASDALGAASALQRALRADPGPYELTTQIGMALHTGEAESHEGEYQGPTVAHCGTLCALANRGQVLVSAATEAQARELLPPEVKLTLLGTYTLSGSHGPERLFQLVNPQLPASFPPLRALLTPPTNLPAPVTSFVGRTQDLAEITQLLARTAESENPADLGAVRCRLVTLTGAGGCGKTRLALEAAATLLPMYPDGAWLVELAAMPASQQADPTPVAQAVSTTLGLREEPGSTMLATLIAHLQARQQLLVLDNCEHLVAACAELAAILLGACPRLRILATSREALGIAGETAWLVPCLSVPGPRSSSARTVGSVVGPGNLPGSPDELLQFEAVRLFVERARAGRQGFALTPQHAEAVARICRQLDGIPLAIELAAARVGVLTVEQLAARLDDRFRLLIGGSRAALPRQQTLRATIDWSYALLSEAERKVLRRLSVFASGCTLEAAEMVCADPRALEAPTGAQHPIWAITPPQALSQTEDEGFESRQDAGTVEQQAPTDAYSILDLLSQLVAKSLVLVSEHGGEARYGMLETVRQYAREHLAASGEEIGVRARHLDWCLTLAEQAEAARSGAAQTSWLERLEAEHDNFRVALEWSLAEDRQEGRPLTVPEAHRRERDAAYLSVTRAGAPARWTVADELVEAGLRLATALCWFWELHGYLSEGLRWLESGLARLPAHLEAAHGAGLGLTTGAGLALARVRLLDDRMTADMERSSLRARALNGAGRLTQCLGNYSGAAALQEEGLVLWRELGEMRGVALTLNSLGNLTYEQGEYARAAALNEESLALWQAMGDKQGIAAAFHNLGLVAQQRGDYVRAGALHRQSLALQRELEDTWGIAVSLNNLGNVALQLGDHERVRGLYEESLNLFRSLGDKRGVATVISSLGRVAQGQGDATQAATLYEESLALRRELGDTWGKAASLTNLGVLAQEFGDTAQAVALHEEGLALFRELGNRWGIAASLEGLATVAGSQGHLVQAARLFGAAAALREALGAQLPPADRERYERSRLAVLGGLGDHTFLTAWKEGEAMALDEAIAYASSAAAHM